MNVTYNIVIYVLYVRPSVFAVIVMMRSHLCTRVLGAGVALDHAEVVVSPLLGYY